MRQFLRGMFGLKQFQLQQFAGPDESGPEPTVIARTRLFIKNIGRMLNG